jgi:hypothetical protein
MERHRSRWEEDGFVLFCRHQRARLYKRFHTAPTQTDHDTVFHDPTMRAKATYDIERRGTCAGGGGTPYGTRRQTVDY